jgi:small subunit ribosomal protein S1
MVEKKIALSIKSLQTAIDKAELASYMGAQGEATSSFGDLLKEKLKKSTEE